MSITMKYYGRPASEQAVSGATAATTVYYLCSLQIVLPLQWFGRSRSLELITVDFCHPAVGPRAKKGSSIFARPRAALMF